MQNIDGSNADYTTQQRPVRNYPRAQEIWDGGKCMSAYNDESISGNPEQQSIPLLLASFPGHFLSSHGAWEQGYTLACRYSVLQHSKQGAVNTRAWVISSLHP